MSNRSQFILDYQLKPEPATSMKYKYIKESLDDDMSDNIIRSKNLFQYEDNFILREEQLKRRFGKEATELSKRFLKHAEKIDPMDSDFNYYRIDKLSREHVYEVIEEEIKKFNNTNETMKVFSKRNQNLNFFLCDLEGILDEQEQEFTKGKNLNNNKQGTSNEISYWVVAIFDTFSQGKCFFAIENTQKCEVVGEYDDGIYLEIKNPNNPNQIGIFKKSHFQNLTALAAQIQSQENQQQFDNDLSREHKPEYDDRSEGSLRNSGGIHNIINSNTKSKLLSGGKSTILTTPIKAGNLGLSQTKNSSAFMSTADQSKKFY